ncbi:hypothetical protein C7S18_20275 [Ahniella affigens]|uniref:Uncharacterized protein n=1 Tax=Ahniella affigens TaxID=2021234 RepID=A0A2P1PX29_9GAMM|nr:hypothetical protein [Ahniella affigens]AVP99364.1 hypothetical protein C7S18_20275 [Ahniella affigens]
MKKVSKLLLAAVLLLSSLYALADPVAYRNVSINPIVLTPALRQILLVEYGNYTLQPGQSIRLLNEEMGLYGDWTPAEIDGNPSTTEFSLMASGTYAVIAGGSGGGAAGSWQWVTILWNSSWTTECRVGSQSISCDDETEFP